MGAVCGKPSPVAKDFEESPKQRELLRKASELRHAISSRRAESFPVREKLENEGVKFDKKANGSRRVWDDSHEQRRETSGVMSNFPEIRSLPKAAEGELVAAGWPAWLVSVSGEAIRGWIPRKADTFEKLDKIGQGTYSSVYKGRDLLNNEVVALKRVRFDNMDPESVKFMAREILILRRLDHPNIIKLKGLVASKNSRSLYLVFEYMEHDLTGLASVPDIKFTESQVKCYMKQLLSGLDYCHTLGVLHRDIKGSNLLIDDHGILKIADFGLASYFDNNQKAPLTSRVVTLWYRPPELLLGATQYGVAVDLWSTGCILGELYTGKPIMPGRTEVEQLHEIFKLCGSPSDDYWQKSKLPHSPAFKSIQSYRRRISQAFKNLPTIAIWLLETLLSIDPSDRGTASSALKSEFFKTPPLACDPSSLPKYPPSKEIDAKFREEQGRRQGSLGSKGQKGDNTSKRSKDWRTSLAPAANSGFFSGSMKRRYENANPKSQNELSNRHREKLYSGLLDPPICARGIEEAEKDDMRLPINKLSYSGPLTPGFGLGLPATKFDDLSIDTTGSNLYPPSSFMASSASAATYREPISSNAEARDHQRALLSQSFRNPMRRQGMRCQPLPVSGPQKAESGGNKMKEPTVDVKERKLHFSGPLLAHSNNIEQVLKEHDRRIQEVARRIRQEKAKAAGLRAA